MQCNQSRSNIENFTNLHKFYEFQDLNLQIFTLRAKLRSVL